MQLRTNSFEEAFAKITLDKINILISIVFLPTTLFAKFFSNTSLQISLDINSLTTIFFVN